MRDSHDANIYVRENWRNFAEISVSNGAAATFVHKIACDFSVLGKISKSGFNSRLMHLCNRRTNNRKVKRRKPPMLNPLGFTLSLVSSPRLMHSTQTKFAEDDGKSWIFKSRHEFIRVYKIIGLVQKISVFTDLLNMCVHDWCNCYQIQIYIIFTLTCERSE